MANQSLHLLLITYTGLDGGQQSTKVSCSHSRQKTTVLYWKRTDPDFLPNCQFKPVSKQLPLRLLQSKMQARPAREPGAFICKHAESALIIFLITVGRPYKSHQSSFFFVLTQLTVDFNVQTQVFPQETGNTFSLFTAYSILIISERKKRM